MGRKVYGKLLNRVLCLLAVLLTLGAGSIRAQAEEIISSGINWMVTEDEGILPGTVEVPILMYHNLTAKENDPAISKDTMWVGQFQRQLELLKENGFQAISLAQLFALVEQGKPLPEKPVLLTFDDGYSSVYDLAFPILKEMEMPAVVFPIGVSVGKDTYKGTSFPIIPHFDWQQAKEMVDSGLISLQSHTYDLHQQEEYELASGQTQIRPDALRQPWETEEEYAEALARDLTLSRVGIEMVTGQEVVALAYPGGRHNDLSEELVASNGIKCTFTIEPGKAQVRPGCPDSLFSLNRFYVQPSTTDEELLKWVS